MPESLIARLRRFDEERPGFPGEHWLALAAGLWLLGRGRGTSLGGLATLALGVALVARAASGRDGIARLLSDRPSRRAADRLGRRRPHERYIDIAAPWPYEKRVRVAAITQPLSQQVSSTP